jgi:hypothetical protein
MVEVSQRQLEAKPSPDCSAAPDTSRQPDHVRMSAQRESNKQ